MQKTFIVESPAQRAELVFEFLSRSRIGRFLVRLAQLQLSQYLDQPMPFQQYPPELFLIKALRESLDEMTEVN